MKIDCLLLFWIVASNIAGHAATSSSEWETRPSRNSYVEFVEKNRSRITTLRNLTSRDRSDIVGLELTDAPPDTWAKLGQELTNVVCLRITWSATDVPVSFFEAVLGYRRLQYLHLQCRNAQSIPSSISLLTNLPLQYVGLDAPSARTISSATYQIRSLKELLLVVGTTRLPDGISDLRALTRLSIHGKRTGTLRGLPADMAGSSIECLELATVRGIETLLPVLPHGLRELRVLQCDLHTIPAAWCRADRLEIVDLANNKLAEFPLDMLGIPSLKLLSLDLNRIAVVPPLSIGPERTLKISVIGNPIADFAFENEVLLERGIIEK